MTGAPAAAALEAGRTFLAHRATSEEIGIVAFNGEISVLQQPDEGRRRAAADAGDAAAARVRDADPRRDRRGRSRCSRDAKLSSGSIVLLSDGADIGSVTHAGAGGRGGEGAAGAHLHRRPPLRRVRPGAAARRSPSAPAAPTPKRGRPRSSRRSTRSSAPSSPASISSATAPPRARCRRSRSQIEVAGAGEAATAYVAPTPSLLAPYHRSPVSTFLLSGGSPLVLALFFGLLVCVAAARARPAPEDDGRRPRRELRERVAAARTRRERRRGCAARGDAQPLRHAAGGRSSSATSSSRG